MKPILKITSLILRVFYKNIEGANPFYVLATVFFTQKILGFNRFVSWPMHHSSRALYTRNIKLGKGSFPGWMPGCYIQARNGITLGDNVRLGPNVGIISANHSPNNFDQWQKTEPIIIGNNVWIGMNSTILPGIIIGSNVVIGANSVVTHNIPSNSIAAGNPCKIMKKNAPYEGTAL